MFIKILTETLMIFLITYALMDILCRFAKLLIKQSEQKNIRKKLILYCDEEDSIEHVIRSSVKNLNEANCEIILALKQETHESRFIAERLTDEFPNVKIIDLSNVNTDICFENTLPQT